jgi:mannose-6-phosphate isomerase-like protein (cupin superfamily)
MMSRKIIFANYISILFCTFLLVFINSIKVYAAEDNYKDLLGEWSGIWPGMSYDRTTLIIHEIDTEKSKARITFMTDRLDSGHEEYDIIADFIPDPRPTLKFNAVKNDFTCIYLPRSKKLEVSYVGDSRGVQMSNSVKMEKRQQIITQVDEILEKNPLPADKKAQAIKIAENDNVTISLIRSTEGAGLKPHFHATHDETMYIIKGAGQIFISDKWVEVKPGNVHFNPTGKTHTIKQTGAEPLVFISIFTPGMKNQQDRHMLEK